MKDYHAELAAIRIQAAFRRHLAKQYLKTLLDNKILDENATIIQKHVRRRAAQGLLVQYRHDHAATRIQVC